MSENVKQSADVGLEYPVSPKDLVIALRWLLRPYEEDGTPKEQASTMIWGAMGVGKTEIVRSIGEQWGRRIVALHLPQFDPTDLKGIPVRTEEGHVKWVPSSYLPQQVEIPAQKQNLNEKGELHEKYDFSLKMPAAEDIAVYIRDASGNIVSQLNDSLTGPKNDIDAKVDIDMIHTTVTVHIKPDENHKNLVGYTVQIVDKALLFLDELSAATPQVQNAALQMVLDRRVGEYDVPVFTPLVAAGNRESDAAFVHPMSAPLANRFCHLRLKPNVDDWIEWALDRRVHPHIIGYIKWKGSTSLLSFEPDKMAEGDGGFATPRSWYKLDQQMNKTGMPVNVMNAIITGYVGKGMGHDFIGYRSICELLPSTDLILSGGLRDFDEELDIGQKYGLATALCYKLKDYHDNHYDDSLEIEDADKQPEEWKTAAGAFCAFVDKHLGREMTTLCITIVARSLGISFTKFKGYGNFAEFAVKYREILRKIV